jgi:hypothetical protein
MAVFTGLGSAASPSITFSADTNTGIFSPGADQVAISTNGTGRLSVDANGCVGVGMTPDSQAYRLQIYNSSQDVAAISLGNNVSGSGALNGLVISQNQADTQIINRENGYLSIATNNTERMRLTSAGLLGLGTSTPAANIDVIGATSGAANNTITGASLRVQSSIAGGENFAIRYRDATNGISGINSCIQLIGQGANALELYTIGAAPLVLGTNAVERLRITSAGLLGLGTSSPSEILDCKGNIVLGAQNAASATLQPTSGSGTDIAGSSLVLRSGRSTGSGSSGEIQILPSPGSTVSGTTLRGNGSSGFYMRLSPTSWADNPTLGLLTVALGSGISQANRSGLGGDSTVLTIDGCDTNAQAALEIVGTNNSGGGDQGFIRFFGSSSKNPYATIAAVTPASDYTSGILAIRTYNAGVEGTVATFTNTGRLGIGTSSPSSLLHLADAGHITVGTTTGTKIGTATTQKIGFFDKTPVVQPTAVADATDAASAITQLNALLTRMRNLGLIAT